MFFTQHTNITNYKRVVNLGHCVHNKSEGYKVILRRFLRSTSTPIETMRRKTKINISI